MREMYIEEITKNLNLLSEHFLKCVWIFTSNLASDKKGGARWKNSWLQKSRAYRTKNFCSLFWKQLFHLSRNGGFADEQYSDF